MIDAEQLMPGSKKIGDKKDLKNDEKENADMFSQASVSQDSIETPGGGLFENRMQNRSSNLLANRNKSSKQDKIKKADENEIASYTKIKSIRMMMLTNVFCIQ